MQPLFITQPYNKSYMAPKPFHKADRSVQPQFGGVSDVIARGVGKISKSALMVLLLLDVLGMCIPRPIIEAWQRPKEARVDAARETTVREFTGLISNTFMVGWLSYFSLGLLGNRMGRLNPQGLPGKAWISADSLEAFGKLYQTILQDKAIKTPEEARSRFVVEVLESIECGDKKSITDNLKRLVGQLGEHPEAQTVMKKSLHDKRLARLSDDAVADVAKMFSLNPGSNFLRITGTNPFDEWADIQQLERLKAEARVTLPMSELSKLAVTAQSDKWTHRRYYAELKKLMPKTEPAKQSRFSKKAKLTAEDEAFIKARLRFSKNDLNGAEKEFIKVVDKAALMGGLTDSVTVQWKGLKKPLNKNRTAFLKEMKHFLEQYVDRATHGFENFDDANLATVERKLFAKKPGGILRRWIPQIEDGLVTAGLKSKSFFTYVPLALTIAFSIAVAFINNWYTKRKHGGVMYYPADGNSSAKTGAVKQETSEKTSVPEPKLIPANAFAAQPPNYMPAPSLSTQVSSIPSLPAGLPGRSLMPNAQLAGSMPS